MKKHLLLLLLTSIVACLGYFGYNSYQKIEQKKLASNRIKHLPLSTDFNWVGKQPASTLQPCILLFFHPDCEYCQYEAQAIAKHIVHFGKVNLWWISSADTNAIAIFGKKYGLSSFSNAYLARLMPEKVPQVLGSVSVPHIFIYNQRQLLQKEFKGETKVEALLKYSNSY